MKYIDRGRNNSIVLIPGWAADYRIFDYLDLKFNYLVPVNFSPVNFKKSLLKILKENRGEKISLFGWSLGGFVAAEFAQEHPNMVDNLLLASIRRRYEAEKLKEIKRQLIENRKGYLCKFYTRCFAKREQMSWFRKNLLKDYCENFHLNYLLETLDYLENAEIKPESLNSVKKIKIIHGECDSIAPIQEAIDISRALPHADFVCIKDAGHAPFLKKDFARYIHG